MTSKRAGVTSRPAERAGKRLASSKRDERQRRQGRIRLRRGALVAAAVALVAVACWGVSALVDAPLWSIRKVEVEGNRHLTDDQVRQLAAVPTGTSLLRFGGGAVERRVEADPWVASATVDRDFPSTVRVLVEERSAGAVIDVGGADLWVVSGDGVWLSPRSAEDTGLVVVRDIDGLKPEAGEPVGRAEASNALKVVAGLSRELRSQVRIVSAPSVDETALLTQGDVEIFIGEAERIAEKDRVAREILEREKGKVVYINVRVVDRPTWRGL